MKRFILVLLLFVPVALAAQQQFEQTVRGVVLEKNTREPLLGAHIKVVAGSREFGTATNEKGEFMITGIPVGRCNIYATMVGFTPFVSNSVLVYSGKETVLEIALEENILALDEVLVTPKVDKELPLNRLAVVSARMLSSEEANRYAGSLAGDPARMVAGFAGVIAANDTRNDIIIRGNSPMGLLWRLDGFEIPNPNHFGAMGGTGGPIGMLNNNQLSNSDFYTGAFPAEFGNATSGVFDLRLRNGNNQKHEFLASAGMNGFELGAEGPLSKKTGASYMINGRYSFLALLRSMGIVFMGSAVPEYQDVCAKINVPLKSGNLSWVTLLGASQIHTEPDFTDTSDWIEGEKGQDMKLNNRQLFTGMNYTRRFSASTRLENRLSYQFFGQKINLELVEYPTLDRTKDDAKLSVGEGRIAYQSTLNHRINVKNVFKTGIGADVFLSDIYNMSEQTVFSQYKGNSTLIKAFAQWQHRITNALSLIPGIYGQYYTFNGDYAIEPRMGFKWEASPATSFSLGGGLFSQLQPRNVYVYEIEGALQNKNLKMSKSWQTVAGYQQKIGAGLHLKAEVYYQSLFNVPVAPDIPEESMLNLGDDYYNSWDYILVNQGTGRNYGVEFTLEKFFNRHYYFLLTASLYDSKYKGYDKIERSTKFAGNYAFNGLFGYEWKLGAKSLLSVNTKLAFVGGKRYTPLIINTIDETYEFDYTQAYIHRLPAYFRTDLNINMKQNFKRWSVEWFIEINNLTNHRNIWQKYYNASRNREEYDYQYSLMPIGGCRIYF